MHRSPKTVIIISKSNDILKLKEQDVKSIKSFLILIIGIVFMLDAFLLPFQWLAFNADYYVDGFVGLKVHEDIGISVDDLDRVTRALVTYIDDGSGDLTLLAEVNGNTVQFYNEKEQHHLNDILLLVEKARRFLLISNIVMILALLSLYLMHQKKMKPLSHDLMHAMRVATFASLACLSALMILYFTDFNWAFTKFHEIFFNNDLWLLDPRTDRLIVLMPLEFFIGFVSDWLMRVAVIFFIFILVGFILPLHHKKRTLKRSI